MKNEKQKPESTDVVVVLCQCGCGEPAPIANRTDSAQGCVKGEPKRFIHNHHRKNARSPLAGRKRSKSAVKKMVLSRCGREPVYSPFLPDTIVGFNKKGNRWFCKGSGKRQTHAKVVYEKFFGPVPDGFHVHHKCGDPSKLENDHPGNLLLISATWNLRYLPTLRDGFGIPECILTDKMMAGMKLGLEENQLFTWLCKEVIPIAEVYNK